MKIRAGISYPAMPALFYSKQQYHLLYLFLTISQYLFALLFFYKCGGSSILKLFEASSRLRLCNYLYVFTPLPPHKEPLQ